MNVPKIDNFPLERVYFLESREFLDIKEKIYLKENLSFKLNSYYLGMSKIRVQNDKILNLYNGLRGYYNVRSRFVKNPSIFETKAPMSKNMYNFIYRMRKYKYQDLIIYSLKQFSRPTINLIRDLTTKTELYKFPHNLTYYLIDKRKARIKKTSYFFWKSNFFVNQRFVFNRFFVNPRRRNQYSFRRLKMVNSRVVGYSTDFFLNYYTWVDRKIAQYHGITRRFFIKLFRRRRGRRKMRRRRKLFKTNLFFQLLLLLKIKSRNKIYKSYNFSRSRHVRALKEPKLDRFKIIKLSSKNKNGLKKQFRFKKRLQKLVKFSKFRVIKNIKNKVLLRFKAVSPHKSYWVFHEFAPDNRRKYIKNLYFRLNQRWRVIKWISSDLVKLKKKRLRKSNLKKPRTN